MKKLLISVGVIVVLLFAGMFAIAHLAPIDKIKAEVIAAVKKQTGRDLAFTDAKVMFWPAIGVQLKDVTFSNAAWSGEKTMASLGSMDVRLAVVPLLHKEVEVKKFVLSQPVIHLEKGADGRANWTFDGAADEAKKDSAPTSAGGGDMAFRFSEFQIEKGTVTYDDRQSGQSVKLDNIDITLNLPDFDSAAKLQGAADYLGQRVKVNLDLEKPKAFSEGKPSAGSLTLDTALAKASLAGTLATSGAMLQNGKISADIASLSKLNAWLNKTAAKPMPFEKVSFNSAAAVANDTLTLKGAALKLDDIDANGDMSVNYGGAKPSVNGTLSVGKIALDRFTGGATGDAAPAKGNGNEGWSAEKIDFSGLKSLNADLTLKTGGFSLKGADVGPSVLNVSLKEGNLHFTSSDAALFGGKFSSDLSVNSAPATPTMAFRFKMDGVDAEPVLTTFAGFDKLSGKVDANVDVTAAGQFQKAIVNALQGSGAATFRNGALKGIDLANIAKSIQGGLTNMNIGGGKTDFVELGGTFKITNGVAHNDDLKMRGPLLQCTGAGDINLPAKSLNYRVVPVLTASSGVDNAKGLTIPVIISGPFSGISVRPDMKGMIENFAGNKEAVKETLQNAKENLKDMKTNLKDLKKDPIGGLLGGGLFGKKTATEAAAPETSGAIAPAPAAAPAPEAAKEAAPAPAAAPEPAPAAEPAAEPAPAAPAEETPATP